eukprot:CAMPEP_0183377634 /NCGR_PEP_ID=MMETSP0164_2-20130417/123558_1 /TAXON_ID=221442 /ORGANISM="Coccolithus pelagicus ssp braarudi, Strain PLY182g" /LENGTH=238 /DNA_ID=CAMNT_0025555111 /DNA_START=99 /DNA_END=812 /DNA_ORIENTATION=+
MGFFSQSIPVGRAALADITQHAPDGQRAWCFAVSGACLSATRALSTALTGMLADVRLVGGTNYPYLTAMGAASLPIFAAAILTAACFHESLARLQPQYLQQSQQEQLLCARGGHLHRSTGTLIKARHLCCFAEPAWGRESCSLVEMRQGLRLVFVDRRLRPLTACYALNMAANGAILVGLISLLELPRAQGGLGLSARLAGAALFWFGIAALAFQLLFFKSVVGRLGILVTYRYVGCG